MVNVTGSVLVIGEKELDARPITNLTQAFSGTSTGLSVTQTDGTPGRDGATIRIRGIGTLNDASPLVLIDGIQAAMGDINPNDVESISILKDASAAAIYGSRAANGVILITTKKGKSGTMKVHYNTYVGIQEATRMMDYLSDMATYMEMNNEIGGYYSEADIEDYRNHPNDPLNYPNVDWVDIIYGGRGLLQSHNLSVLGGSDNSRYNFSFGYQDHDGVVPANYAKRYNVRLNWETDIRKNLRFGTNISGSWQDIQDPNEGNP